jgi:hypothetical protein
MKDILDKKFIHHMWYKHSGLTIRQALELLATEGGISIRQKERKAKKNESINLFDPIKYDDYLISDERGSYRLTEIEKEYYLQRMEIHKNLQKRFNEEYEKFGKDMNYCEWAEYKRNERMKIPEYADANNQFNIAYKEQREKEKKTI